MRVWVINPYGNLPGESWRPHRSFMVSQAFSEMGHQVNYWISDIDHRSKQKRNATNFFIENINVQVIKSNVYASHISLKRIQFEVNFIKQFIVEANLVQQKPDLILIGEPSLFISVSFVKFAQANNIPFIIDMIDLWPDLFKITLPQWLRRFEKIIFAPFYIKRAWFIKKAIGIISVSKAYLEVAKKINTSGNFKYLYWGVDLSSFQNVEKIDFGFQKTKNQFWIIYAGTLGNNYDTKSLIELGKLIEYSKIDYKLFIAGDGNLKELVVQTIKSLNLKKTIYLGRVSPEELVGFYKNCDIALSTYTKDSTVSMPIKAFDYFAAGLPILNSLGMDLGDFVEECKVGLNYEPGSYKDLFNKLEYLSQNPNVVAEMKHNSKELGMKFDQKLIYKEYVQFCESTLSVVKPM